MIYKHKHTITLMTFQSVISSNVIGIAGILVFIVIKLPIGLSPIP